MVPAAEARTASPSSPERLRSTALGGLWVVKVVPAHTWLHGNGIWWPGAAWAGAASARLATTTPAAIRANLRMAVTPFGSASSTGDLTYAGPIGVKLRRKEW